MTYHINSYNMFFFFAALLRFADVLTIKMNARVIQGVVESSAVSPQRFAGLQQPGLWQKDFSEAS